MGQAYLARALLELMQIRETPSRSNRVLHDAPEAFDVIVTTHKTIDLVFHTQVCKLKRDMTHKNSVSASSIAFMQNEGMEVITVELISMVDRRPPALGPPVTMIPSLPPARHLWTRSPCV